MQKVYLVRIKKLPWQVIHQWYANKVKSGQIRKVVEVYFDGVIQSRSILDKGFIPIPRTHYVIIREL